LGKGLGMEYYEWGMRNNSRNKRKREKGREHMKAGVGEHRDISGRRSERCRVCWRMYRSSGT